MMLHRHFQQGENANLTKTSDLNNPPKEEKPVAEEAPKRRGRPPKKN